jgi:hypothetical protein
MIAANEQSMAAMPIDLLHPEFAFLWILDALPAFWVAAFFNS